MSPSGNTPAGLNPEMKKCRQTIMLCCLLFAAALVFAPYSRAEETLFAPQPVLVEFFTSHGCPQCATIRQEILPAAKERYGDLITVIELDIANPTNLIALINTQERLSVKADSTVSLLLGKEVYLAGLKEVRKRLEPELDKLVSRAMCETDSAAEERIPATTTPPEIGNTLIDRFETYTIPAVILGGLGDGINPCAFATIIFLATLLMSGGNPRRKILMVGIPFCVATFVTYFLIGLTALSIVRKLAAIETLKLIFNLILCAVLMLLAFLSARDAIRFARGHDSETVSLQMPKSLKLRAHRIMRNSLRSHHLILAGVILGFIVTLIETACTGQLYLPVLCTLAQMKETGHLRFRVYSMLLIYNAAFISPLIVILGASLLGANTSQLIRAGRNNVVWGKIFLSLLFATLALITFWLALHAGQ